MLSAAVIEEMNQPSELVIEERDIIDPTELGDNFLKRFMDRVNMFSTMTEEQINAFELKEAIKEYQRFRNELKDRPDDYWRVYDLCKRIDEIAEIEKVPFAKASLTEKIATVSKLIKFVEPEVLIEGVVEYHESGWCKYER